MHLGVNLQLNSNQPVVLASSVTPLTLIDGSGVSVVEWFRSDLQCSGASWTGQKAGTVAPQPTPAKQPLFTASDPLMNGRPSLIFNGAGHELPVPIAAPAPGTQKRWYWMIVRNVAISVPAMVMCGAGASSHIIYRQGTDTASQLSQFNGTKGNTTGNFSTGVARRLAAYFSASVNDYLQIGSAKTKVTNTGNGSAASLFLGSSGGGNYANIAISEYLICDDEPPQSTRDALDAYALDRYSSVVLA